MKRILVGVDGSKESRDAAVFAANIAKATHAQLYIVSAVPGVSPLDWGPEMVSRAQEWTQKERDQARTTVDQMAASLGSGVKIETLVAFGAPAVALSELAKEGDVELVVVGHRGRNAVARALLGSVADRLVQICPKPVLVVR